MLSPHAVVVHGGVSPQRSSPSNQKLSAEQEKIRKTIGTKMEFDLEYSLAEGKLIGQGAFGSVYRCRSSNDNQEWAIKIIEVPDREEYRHTSEREVLISLQMQQHPSVIAMKRVYTWTNEITHKYVTALVLELADKGLFDVYDSRRKQNILFSDDEVLAYLAQSIDGLSFLYKAHGICHRDIKTENLLLKQNKIKITDFGVSKTIHEERMRSLQANTIAGTPLFLSPKVWEAYIKRNEYNVVHDLLKSDVFSLGLVFLQLTLLLSNQQVAGLNQSEGERKLASLFTKVRSNKLRTIFAAMLAFDEVRRADYEILKRMLAQPESEFNSASYLSHLPQKLQPNSYLQQAVGGGVQGIGGRYNSNGNVNAGGLGDFRDFRGVLGGGQPQGPKNICFRHNEGIEYFCEYENCFECLCIECKNTHTASHIDRVIAYKTAVTKYVEANPLVSNYAQLNNHTVKEVLARIVKYQSNFREEVSKASQDLRKHLQQALDTSLNKWLGDVSNRLTNAGRDAELVKIQTRGEEVQLSESQQKFRANPNSTVYLQMIAKQQAQFETNFARAKDKISSVNADIASLQSIESVYVNFLNSLHPFGSQMQRNFDAFFNSLVRADKNSLASDVNPMIYMSPNNNQKQINKMQQAHSPNQNPVVLQQYTPQQNSPIAQLPAVVPVQNIKVQQQQQQQIKNQQQNSPNLVVAPPPPPPHQKTPENQMKQQGNNQQPVSNFQTPIKNNNGSSSNVPPTSNINLKVNLAPQQQQMQPQQQQQNMNPNIPASAGKQQPQSQQPVSSRAQSEQQVQQIAGPTQLYPTKEFTGNPGPLQDLLFISQSKTKHLLISSQPNGKIIKVQLSNEERSEIQLETVRPRTALYLVASKKIVYGTQDGGIFIFDPINMKMIDSPFKESQNSPITCMSLFEKRISLMLTGSQDGQVVLWDLAKRSQERVYNRLHAGEVKGIITNASDTLMISVGVDRSIILTDLNTNKIKLKCVDAHSAAIVAVKKIKENSFLTAGADGFVKLWELNADAVNLIGDCKLHSSPITLLEYYPKYNLIVTSAKEGTLYFTDPKDYAKVAVADMKFLPGGANGVHWEKPFLYTSDACMIKKWNNPEFDATMAGIRKKVQANNANCTIF